VKLVFPTDEHYPFQDEKARSVALQITRDFNPDLRISGSDGMDFYNLSHFDRNPERMKTGLQDEIDQWKKGQKEWRDAAPSARAFYLRSNHDLRLERYLWSQAQELATLKALQLPHLLELDSLGIEWEYRKGQDANLEIEIEGKLVIKHGTMVRKLSSMSAKAELENEFHGISVATGHTHRGGSYYVTTRHGMVQAHECFCLCRLDPEYIQHPNWQQGLMIAEVTRDFLAVEMIPFYSNGTQTKAIWRGKEYRSE
jgi:hypothetical protein